VFGPYDREIPGTVPQYDFQLFHVPGVHLPEGVVAECPTNLFLLFFTLDMMSKVMEHANKKGNSEQNKVRPSIM
jgi:hypothetical protein